MLTEFLKKQDTPFINQHGLAFKLEFEQEIQVSLPLVTESDLTACLTAEYELNAFAAVADLHDFDTEKLLAPYWRGTGEISIRVAYEELELGFRIIGNKTIIYSASYHFYDESYALLKTPEDFAAYIMERQSLLEAAMECRNKFINATKRIRRKYL